LGRTVGAPLITRDTVLMEMPEYSATSLIVAMPLTCALLAYGRHAVVDG
jgi:hypothetical protein